MDWVDFTVLAGLAAADLLLLAYFRRRRQRALRLERVQQSLVLAVREANRVEQCRHAAAADNYLGWG
jgi:hypothetical protein